MRSCQENTTAEKDRLACGAQLVEKVDLRALNAQLEPVVQEVEHLLALSTAAWPALAWELALCLVSEWVLAKEVQSSCAYMRARAAGSASVNMRLAASCAAQERVAVVPRVS